MSFPFPSAFINLFTFILKTFSFHWAGACYYATHAIWYKYVLQCQPLATATGWYREQIVKLFLSYIYKGEVQEDALKCYALDLLQMDKQNRFGFSSHQLDDSTANEIFIYIFNCFKYASLLHYGFPRQH